MSKAKELADAICRIDTLTEYQRELIAQAAAELRRLDALEQAAEPVAWGHMRNGVIRDCIAPGEVGAEYNIPLYTHPASRKPDDTAPLLARIAELEKELETERMRLAACGVVAMANTRESAEKARQMHPDYRSASCQDVMRAVDAEMGYRERIAELEADAKRYRWLRSVPNGFKAQRIVNDTPHGMDAAIDAAMKEQP